MFTEALFDELNKLAESKSDHKERRLVSGVIGAIPGYGVLSGLAAAKGRKVRTSLGQLAGATVGGLAGGTAGLLGGAALGGPLGAGTGLYAGGTAGVAGGGALGAYLAHGKYKGKKKGRR